MEIQLTQGKVTIIDDDDWPLVSQYKWHKKKNTTGTLPRVSGILDAHFGFIAFCLAPAMA